MAANIVSNENESNHEYHSVPLENKVQDNSSKLPHSSSTSQITGMDSSPTPVVPQHQMSESKTPPPQNHRRIFKIIVIGDSNVGKTCLTFRFCGGKFLQRSEATIGVDFREKTIQIDDETIKLQIWDTGTLDIMILICIIHLINSSFIFNSGTREIQEVNDISLLPKCTRSFICL